MKKIRKTLAVCFAFLMIFLALSIVCVGTVVGVDEAEMPKYSVGDEWKWSIDWAEVEGIGELRIRTAEITEDSVEITQFGESYVCYETDIRGNWSLYGTATGNGTINGKHYFQKSDLSDVKRTSTHNGTFIYAGESHAIKHVFNTTWNPPFDYCKGFPLTVGKSWSVATNRTTTTQTTIDGQVDQETDTTTGTWSYIVHKTELTTVPAGEFDTFAIKWTDPDGDYGEFYFCQEVGSDVKGKRYDPTGKLVYTYELLEYSYAAAEEGFPWLLVIAGIVIAAAVIASGVGYFLYRRKKPTVPAAPSTPPTEQPPQPTTLQY